MRQRACGSGALEEVGVLVVWSLKRSRVKTMPPTPTDYKEKSAKVMRLFWQQMMRALPEFVFWKDRHSVYLNCNQNYAELLGLTSPDDIVGKTDADLHWQPSGHTADVFRQGDWDTMHGHPITQQEETLVLPNGRKLMTLVSKLPILDEQRRVLGIVGYFSDISVLKEKEHQLKIAKQQAEAANRAKSLFLTHISHDIRTPLTGLLGMAQVLSQEIKTETGQAAVSDLTQTAQSMLHFLNEVIEFSKWDSGDLPVYDVKFNLSALIADTLALVTPAAKEKQLSLTAVLPPRLPEALIGDVLRLQRILLNLLTNAIKFTAHGFVELSVSILRKKQREILVQFQVKDSGIGIPKAQQPSIFTRFSRLHPSYHTQYSGVGLGLALVKRFVSELGGEIDVVSEEHQGATFTCFIPLRCSLMSSAAHFSSALKIQEKRHKKEFSRKKILLVEDNAVVRRAIQHQLETVAPGLEIITAATGAEALAQIQAQNFHLVIMDLGLPDAHGCDIAAAIHAWQHHHHRPRSPIVALSAHLQAEEQKRCFEAQIIETFTKPLDAQKAQKLLRLLKKPKEKQEIISCAPHK